MNLSFFWKVTLLILFTLAEMFLMRKIVEGIINLFFVLKDKNKYNTSYQHQGIVLNKKSKRLEADNSLITPF